MKISNISDLQKLYSIYEEEGLEAIDKKDISANLLLSIISKESPCSNKVFDQIEGNHLFFLLTVLDNDFWLDDLKSIFRKNTLNSYKESFIIDILRSNKVRLKDDEGKDIKAKNLLINDKIHFYDSRMRLCTYSFYVDYFDAKIYNFMPLLVDNENTSFQLLEAIKFNLTNYKRATRSWYYNMDDEWQIFCDQIFTKIENHPNYSATKAILKGIVDES